VVNYKLESKLLRITFFREGNFMYLFYFISALASTRTQSTKQKITAAALANDQQMQSNDTTINTWD
jgi:hypothetical protein